MNTGWEADTLVQCGSQNVDVFHRNFLQQMVCELRFPTLMELGGERPPAAFVNALRKEYPTLELANEVTIGPGGGSSSGSHFHIFRSSSLTWTVSLKQSAIAIETTSYTKYAELRERVLRVVNAAEKIIDSNFFTRIGLRYINIVDRGHDPADGWINSDLVAPLKTGFFKGVKDYAGRIQLASADGGCLLQHGIKLKPSHDEDDAVQPQYLIDIDVYRNDVSLEDVGVAVDAAHIQAFNLFDWSLGPKSREYLCTEKTLRKRRG